LDIVLGLLGVVVFIPCVILVAAAVTWVVVKLTPSRERKTATEQAPS